MSGLTDTGFEPKTLEEIRSEIEASLISYFGAVNLNEESIFGQLVGIFSEREALLWELLQGVYNSMYPDSASGFSLDGVVEFVGIKRLGATATRVTATITAVNQTVIPINSQIGGRGIETDFRLINQVVVSNENCKSITIDVINVDANEYKITINNEQFNYVTYFLDNKASIVNNLVDLINDSDLEIEASNVDEFIYIKVTSDITMTVYISTENLSITEVSTTGQFIANTLGNIPIPLGSLTTIRTPVSGWISVFNDQAGLTGRDLETDEQLRIRRSLSLRRAGSATVEAIRARLLDVPGVTSASVRENDNINTVNGLPPKSFEALVIGGDDLDIGNAIWRSKPAGIEPFGNTEVTITDVEDVEHLIKFSRPVSLFIYVKITITKDNSNSYPSTADEYIKEGIVKQINNLGVGKNVIYQAFYQTIYSIPGIQSAVIEVGSTIDENIVPTLSTANITVSPSQAAVTDVNKITVIIA